MQNQTNIPTKAKSQNEQGTSDAFAPVYFTFDSPSASWLREWGGNTFLVPNKCKGPPGKVRSPVAGACINPDNPTASTLSNKTLLITEFQNFKQIQNPNNFIN